MGFLALANNSLKFFKKIKLYFKTSTNTLKIGALIFGAFITCIVLCFFALSLLVGLLSFVLFKKKYSYIFANIPVLAVIWAFPIFLIVYMYSIWSRFFRKKYKKSFLLSFIPFSIGFLFFLFFLVLGCVYKWHIT